MSCCFRKPRIINLHKKGSRSSRNQESKSRKKGHELHRASLEESDDISRYSILLTGYNQTLEIPWPDLQIDFSAKILSGVFTAYFKGKLKYQRDVMVKTLKENSAISYFKGLVREVKIISALPRHDNIIQLIGAVTQNVHIREIFLVMEYCEFGTLQDNLHNHRDVFVNRFPRDDSEAPMLPRKARETGPIGHTRRLDTIDLLSWAIDIARGMQFLASNRLLHWELAARSVFIAGNGTAKIGDFHSLRRLDFGKDFIVLNETDCPLPWKWMALESLYSCRFTLKSDIWTYGVTLWELFSLGDDPYPGALLDPTFLNELTHGRRPVKPKYAIEQLYGLMNACWARQPDCRPNLSDIIAVLTRIRDSTTTTFSQGSKLYQNVPLSSIEFKKL